MSFRYGGAPAGNSANRLSLALFLAALIHAVVILGVSFSLPDRPREHEALEITLVHTPAKPAQQQADFLAPDDQVGGGPGQAVAQPQAPAMPPQPPAGHPQTYDAPEDRPTPSKQQPVLTQTEEARHKAAKAPDKEQHRPAEASRQARPRSGKIDMTAVQQQISEFSNEFVQAQEKYAKQSKILYINSVSAHKYAAAAYEKAWQDKIERVGNLNYPDEARRNHLSGNLLLSVAIRKDGTLHSIKIRQSSGHAVLDDAAKRIVQLASPFSPFPAGLSEEADVLVITRTWKFFSDSHMSTAP